ncbi:hypothetical protein D3C87_2076990 [compost metagenome]
MIIQVVTVLIIGAALRRRRLPVQHPHTAAPGLHTDYLQHLARTGVGAQFQIG